MMTKPGRRRVPWQLYAAINFLLLTAVFAEGIVAYLASLEIALALGAQVIWEAMGDTVQAKYALVTLRNLWLLAGGIVFLCVIIYGIQHFFKHWREGRLLWLYVALLAVEAHLILASQVMTTA